MYAKVSNIKITIADELYFETSEKVKSIKLLDNEIKFKQRGNCVTTEALNYNALLNLAQITIDDNYYFKNLTKVSENLTNTAASNSKTAFLYFLVKLLGTNKYELLNALYKKTFNLDSNFRTYADKYHKYNVQENTVLIESLNGNDISGDMINLAKLYSENKYEIYIACYNSAKEIISSKCERYGIDAEIGTIYSKDYYKKLLTSKYLLNDSTFFRSFVKKPEQVYINTWHGTPLKKMGYFTPQWKEQGNNTQRNMLSSDLFIQNSMYGVDIMNSSYDVDCCQLYGNPKNDFYFNKSRNEEIRKELGISKYAKVIAYVPTWRGDAFLDENIDDMNTEITKFLEKVNKETSIIFYKPHQSIREQMEIMGHGVFEFPTSFDINDFLNCVDILVTDYSSVMFDYANLNRPIVLYTPDKEDYIARRGLNFPLDELPFKQIETEDELIEYLEQEVEKVDYSEFNKKFNPIESGQSAIKLYENKDTKFVYNNERRKILIYPGSLRINGITTAFNGMLENIINDPQPNTDYYLYLPAIARENFDYETREELPDYIKIFMVTGGQVNSFYDWYVIRQVNSKKHVTKRMLRQLEKNMDREIERLFGNIKFDAIVNFSGFETYLGYLFTKMDCKTYTYAHNDLMLEYKNRRLFNIDLLKLMYKQSDMMVPIASELVPILKDTILDSDTYFVAENMLPIERIKRGADDEEFEYQENDEEILADENIVKFINIARFTAGKSQDRLINAYREVQKANPEQPMHLYLIGTVATEYEKIKALVGDDETISIYTNINPFPILKQCDLFVLSSYFEGLPMAFFESIIFDVPILSVELPAPKIFLESGYGKCCENSVKGLITGMQDYLDNGIEIVSDINDWNKSNYEKFNKLINQEY